MANEDLQHLTPARKFWSAFQACVEENRVQHDRFLFSRRRTQKENGLRVNGIKEFRLTF